MTNGRAWRTETQVSLLLLLAGCQGTDGPETSLDAGVEHDSGPIKATDGAAGSDVQTFDGSSVVDAAADSELPAVPCDSLAGGDHDSDGFAGPVDCNDCDPSVNPAAFDVPKNNIDDDCSGVADDEPASCDAQLGASSDAWAAARALGLCRTQAGSSWGLVDAKWVFPDGSATSTKYLDCPGGRPPHPESRSIRANYGALNLPREGQRMVVLSSGIARPGNDTLAAEWLPAQGTSPSVSMCTAFKPPAGFPRRAAGCDEKVAAPLMSDGIALQVTLKVPSNALALDYDFFFLSSEFPEFVCDGYSDHFVALLKSQSPATPADGNISFDSAGNVVSIDTAFLEVCTPGTYFGRSFACKRGSSAIDGLGFPVQPREDGSSYIKGGATGWLHTRAPVLPGETITIRFGIWDTQDPLGDSTVLLDNVFWTFRERNANAPQQPETTVVLL